MTYTIKEFRQMLSERNPTLCDELEFIMDIKTKGETPLKTFAYSDPILFLIQRIEFLYEGTTEDMEIVFRCCSSKVMPYWAEGALAFLVDSDYLTSREYLKMCVNRWKFARKKNRILVSRCLCERVKALITKAVPSLKAPLREITNIQSVHQLPKGLHLVLPSTAATNDDIQLKHRGIEKFWDRFSARGACLFSPVYIFKRWKYAKLMRKLRPHTR